MIFFIFFNVNIQFVKKKLKQKRHIIIKALFTIQEIEFINKKAFIVTTLNKNTKIFKMYIAIYLF